MNEEMTEQELKMAKIITKWINYYGKQGLDPKAVGPGSLICFDIVRDITEQVMQPRPKEVNIVLETLLKDARTIIYDEACDIASCGNPCDTYTAVVDRIDAYLKG